MSEPSASQDTSKSQDAKPRDRSPTNDAEWAALAASLAAQKPDAAAQTRARRASARRARRHAARRIRELVSVAAWRSSRRWWPASCGGSTASSTSRSIRRTRPPRSRSRRVRADLRALRGRRRGSRRRSRLEPAIDGCAHRARRSGAGPARRPRAATRCCAGRLVRCARRLDQVGGRVLPHGREHRARARRALGERDHGARARGCTARGARRPVALGSTRRDRWRAARAA